MPWPCQCKEVAKMLLTRACAGAPAPLPLTSTGESAITLLVRTPAAIGTQQPSLATLNPRVRKDKSAQLDKDTANACCSDQVLRREDSFAAHNRSSASLKAEDHRHLLRAAQRSASVPPPQRQMLAEYGDSSRGAPLSTGMQLMRVPVSWIQLLMHGKPESCRLRNCHSYGSLIGWPAHVALWGTIESWRQHVWRRHSGGVTDLC